MATVCGSSLALMDAGVPLQRPVAGIAMGLIKEGDKFAVLSDILGDEDHLGDMDFKVAGTTEGVTSLQMDIKITSITEEIMRIALDQARDGRLHILAEMAKALPEARDDISQHAPAHHHDLHSQGQDPRRHRHRRQGDPRDHRSPLAARSTSTTRAATVCGAALAMMDAGVPIKAPVAGIAMGLIKDGDRFAVLSDILGDEDHLGDMDFKVAGTRDGVTALQMDIKITGITEEIMRVALEQARDGRFHILDNMDRALSSAREGVSEHAPRITTLSIPKDKIREVIGTGGKVIREICEVTGAKIDIEDDGTIKVAAVDSGAAEKAIEWIRGIVAEPEIGVIYGGKVVKVVDFGAFVNFLGARDGLVHISELAPRRVGKVTDVVNEGDEVKVKVLGIDDRGKVRLSMKVVDQETGEDISDNRAAPQEAVPSGA